MTHLHVRTHTREIKLGEKLSHDSYICMHTCIYMSTYIPECVHCDTLTHTHTQEITLGEKLSHDSDIRMYAYTCTPTYMNACIVNTYTYIGDQAGRETLTGLRSRRRSIYIPEYMHCDTHIRTHTHRKLSWARNSHRTQISPFTKHAGGR